MSNKLHGGLQVSSSRKEGLSVLSSTAYKPAEESYTEPLELALPFWPREPVDEKSACYSLTPVGATVGNQQNRSLGCMGSTYNAWE